MKRMLKSLLLLSTLCAVVTGLQCAKVKPESFAKRALVCGAGGFIGSHLVERLKSEGYWVRGVDLKLPEFSQTAAHDFILGDLRNPKTCEKATLIGDVPVDEIYQLAADMGGIGFIYEHDAQILHNSVLINVNMAEASRKLGVKRLFYSSSACVYPERNQLTPDHPVCAESSAYPAAPDSEYGWEKLFSERLYKAFEKDHKVTIVRIARFHNIFGPEGTWEGGREKAPAALCRKVALAQDGGVIEIWGDGLQTRSFLYVDECVTGILKLMRSEVDVPLNIGSEEMVTINQLAQMIIDISGKKLTIKHIPGTQGVRGRNSDNHLVREKLQWEPSSKLCDGLVVTYKWIEQQVAQKYGAAKK